MDAQLCAFWAAIFSFHAYFGRNFPVDPNNCFRAIHRFDSANSVSTCTVFSANPRKLTFAYPNCRLITRNGCSTRARTRAFAFSIACNRAFSFPTNGDEGG